MMRKVGAVLSGFLAIMATAAADNPPPAIPADFKIHVAEFGLGDDPVSTEEIVIRHGQAYVFPSQSKEITIIAPAQKSIEIVDVGRRVQAEVSFKTLDESLEKIKSTLRQAVEKREKQGGRANMLEAKMTRDLFETKLATSYDSRSHRVRLSNPTIEVDADGEAESDALRLAMIAATLESIAKLGAFRTPTDLPPFAELGAIASLTDERLKPTSISYLYRLAGPPRKFHRTYRFVSSLTDREVQAIERVDRLREVAQSLRYERYRQDR